jgi:hypothetical protein
MDSQQEVYTLIIPKPCLQEWDAMQSTDGGKHCSFCKKNVLNFSTWTDAAIQEYVIANQSNEICGRFKTSQLETIKITIPTYVFRKKLPVWKYFLLLLLICFGTSFLAINTEIGNSFTLKAQSTNIGNKAKKSSKKAKKKKQKYNTVSIDCEPMTMGVFYHVPEVKKENCNIDIWANTSNIQKIDTAKHNSLPKNEEPVQKKENTTLAFVIPSTTNFRRKSIV